MDTSPSPSPSHQQYSERLRVWLLDQPREHLPRRIRPFLSAFIVLLHLDLEPARAILLRGYSDNPRGAHPKDPITMLRAMLAMVLVGEASFTRWVRRARANPLLAILCGFRRDPFPAVGTFYDFMHRLHDGPQRSACEHCQPPSQLERRRAATSQPKKGAAKRKAKTDKTTRRRRKQQEQARRAEKEQEQEAQKEKEQTTRKLVDELLARHEQDLPQDLGTRLNELLLHVAVLPSAELGLLGDLDKLVACGDGSTLYSGANGEGIRHCACPRKTHCDCPRRYADPDADWGRDSYRERYFFGHRFYELSVCSQKHDLPLALGLGPASETDHTLSLKTLDVARKSLAPQGLYIGRLVEDCGHDSGPAHDYLRRLDIDAVIPLQRSAPALLPGTTVALSSRGVPLCDGGAEMSKNGSTHGGKQVFVCPVKAGKLVACPLAPQQDPTWSCRPDLKFGPTRVVDPATNPRLLPTIARNSATYERLYRMRSGCERSNSVKKTTFLLEAAHHRRKSFWFIRLTLMAILQHARAWVCDIDEAAFLDTFLGLGEARAAA